MTMDNATVGNTNEKNGEETSTSPRRERCTGLHQTNFNPANPLQFSSSALNEHDERTIVSVFRQFRDHCVLRLKDGMTKSSQNLNKQKNSEIHDTKDKEETGDFTNSVTESAESLTSVKSDDAVQLDHLPFYCKLIVLSKLETSDISHLSMTSRHWREVCSDQILWRELLCRDIVKWSNIGLRSFPLLSDRDVCGGDGEDGRTRIRIQDFHSRLCSRGNVNYKALYFHSAYQRQKDNQLIGIKPFSTSNFGETEANINASQTFPRFLRSIWMRMKSGNGEVIMLGPGMESPNTSKIFRRLMWARPDLLMTVRLLQGGQDGVGSGVELEFKGEKRFNLIALYSGNRRDRVRRVGLERLRHSNMLDAIENPSSAPPSENESFLVVADRFRLSAPVANFLQRREGACRLIYVVDATAGQSPLDLSFNRLELGAMLDGVRECESAAVPDGAVDTVADDQQRWPLLVLCCAENVESARFSCVEVAAFLDLAAVTDRMWFVQDVAVDNLSGLEDGLMWLFKQL